MTSVAVLVPVLDRPHRAAPVLRSALSATPGHRVEVIFLVSPGDQAEHEAVEAAIDGQPGALVVVPWQPGPGDYARKINHGFRRAAELGYRWIFQGADDIDFRDGWLDRAVSVHKRTRACWIGTNDTVNHRVRLGRHATHSLIHRDYLECGTIDEPGKILHEQYSHWFCDDEGVQTAMFRGTWAFARDSIVAHQHPLYGGAVMDETYRKGQASVDVDRALYEARCPMWNPAMARRR